MRSSLSIQGNPIIPVDIIKGRTFLRLNVTRKIIIKHVPDLIRSALDMQTFALGKTMCPSTSRKSHGQSSFTSIMPHGGFHQRADLVQHLSPHHIQPPSVHSAHPLCWQSSDLWWQTPYRNGALWSPSWRWFLWKTHHSGDWTGPRISGIHDRKPSLWKWSIKVQPTSLKFSHPFPLLLLPFFWAAFAHVATLSSRVRSQPLVFNKVWPS